MITSTTPTLIEIEDYLNVTIGLERAVMNGVSEDVMEFTGTLEDMERDQIDLKKTLKTIKEYHSRIISDAVGSYQKAKENCASKIEQIANLHIEYKETLPADLFDVHILDLDECIDVFSYLRYLMSQYNRIATMVALLEIKNTSEALLAQEEKPAEISSNTGKAKVYAFPKP